MRVYLLYFYVTCVFHSVISFLNNSIQHTCDGIRLPLGVTFRRTSLLHVPPPETSPSSSRTHDVSFVSHTSFLTRHHVCGILPSPRSSAIGPSWSLHPFHDGAFGPAVFASSALGVGLRPICHSADHLPVAPPRSLRSSHRYLASLGGVRSGFGRSSLTLHSQPTLLSSIQRATAPRVIFRVNSCSRSSNTP